MKSLFISLAVIAAIVALIWWALPAKAQQEFTPLYELAPNLYAPIYRPVIPRAVPLYPPPTPSSAPAHQQWMRDFEAQRAQQDEMYQRMVERNRSRIQQSERSFLERCAQYNRGCLRLLQGGAR